MHNTHNKTHHHWLEGCSGTLCQCISVQSFSMQNFPTVGWLKAFFFYTNKKNTNFFHLWDCQLKQLKPGWLCVCVSACVSSACTSLIIRLFHLANFLRIDSNTTAVQMCATRFSKKGKRSNQDAAERLFQTLLFRELWESILILKRKRKKNIKTLHLIRLRE